jgi:hypothetical protein
MWDGVEHLFTSVFRDFLLKVNMMYFDIFLEEMKVFNKFEFLEVCKGNFLECFTLQTFLHHLHYKILRLFLNKSILIGVKWTVLKLYAEYAKVHRDMRH